MPSLLPGDAFELLPNAVMICDRYGRVVAANARLRAELGSTRGRSCCTVGAGSPCATWVGAAGRIAFVRTLSAASVTPSTTPVARRRCLIWNQATDERVRGPNAPSTGPVR